VSVLQLGLINLSNMKIIRKRSTVLSYINTSQCSRLQYVKNRGYFCGGCGCGNNDLARLDADSPDEYTKLHYPYLECPLKRSGFSNATQEPSLCVIIPV
jgi:hypothetical protein